MAGKAVQRRPLRIPFTYKAETNSTFSVYSWQIQYHNSTHAPSNYHPNCHLSLSAMVDCWAHLGINPYAHLDVAATPIFRLFLGVAKDLFQSLTLLESALHLAIYDHWQRVDDLELVIWVAVWGGWETWQWDDEGSDGDWSHEGRRGKRMLGALGNCKITITVIKYGAWFSCSIYGHHFH